MTEPRTRTRTSPYPRERLLEWYRIMALERALAEGVAERNRQGHYFRPATTPSAGGQEAIGAGICTALRRRQDGWDPPDIIVNTLGGQHYIAMGMDPERLMAESYGKSGGYSRGKAGHLRTSLADGAYGHQGVIGVDFGAAAGLALAAKWQGKGQIVVMGFGDGASNQGKFHEAANFAALHQLPLLFVATNNFFATSVPVWRSTALGSIHQRAQAYGFPGRVLEGNDVVEVHEAALEAIAHVREGKGPLLLELRTFRPALARRRYAPDFDTHVDLDYWKSRDPLRLLRDRATGQGWLSGGELDAIDAEAAAEARRVFGFVDASPDPDPAELWTDGPVPLPAEVTAAAATQPATPHGDRVVSYQDAIRETLQQAMRDDDRVFVIGEDIRASLHNDCTLGLVEEFGEDRVIDTPIVEGMFTGAAIGTALQGYRPVVEIGLMSYITPAIEEVASVLANLRYVSAGRYRLPVVVRTNLAGGPGPTYGATNTQSWHAWFTHVPNLTVCMPATAYDAKGLLATALADDNPVLFIEHRNLYTAAGPVPAERYSLPYGQAAVRRTGSDLTVVAFGITAPMAVEAAEAVAGEGIDAEVLDPRTLKPFDFDTVIRSLEKTGGRLLVCDIGYRTGGAASWVVGELTLRRPGLIRSVALVTSPDTTIPYSNALTAHYFPTATSIAEAIRRLD